MLSIVASFSPGSCRDFVMLSTRGKSDQMEIYSLRESWITSVRL